jgi:hypothetical protein
MTLGTALLLIAAAYLIDKHRLWKKTAFLLGAITLAVGIGAGVWLIITVHRERQERAAANKPVVLDMSTAVPIPPGATIDVGPVCPHDGPMAGMTCHPAVGGLLAVVAAEEDHNYMECPAHTKEIYSGGSASDLCQYANGNLLPQGFVRGQALASGGNRAVR